MDRPRQQTTAFLDALKRCLKARRITYAALATALGLSEASVKRLFSHESLTMKRTEEILAVLDMTFLEVARLAAGPRDGQSSQLTLEQERALAADPQLFSFFHLLLFGASVPRILRVYAVSKEDVGRWLRSLERLALVEQLPRDRVRLRVARSIVWRPRGPLRLAYEKEVRAHFLRGDFEGEHEVRRFATRRMSAGSRALVARKIQRLFVEIDDLSEIDTAEGGDEPSITGLFVAFRPVVLEELAGLPRR
jgi:transcriptional regulator with XRE-family HTH domain